MSLAAFLAGLATAGSVLLPGTLLTAQDVSCAGGGILYLEWPERGPSASQGRPLARSLGTEYGVDINSRIEIKVDTLCLLAFLDGRPGAPTGGRASPELRARFQSLSAAVSAIPLAIQQLTSTYASYAPQRATPDEGFRERLKASSNTIGRILSTLSTTIQARLEEAGVPESTATIAAKDEMIAALAGAEQRGYDWEAIRRLLHREIQLADSALRELHASDRYAVELRAHLLTAEGQSPVPLAGHNDEAPCAATRIEPFELELSGQQAALYQEAEALEKQIGAVRSVGNVVVTAVLRDLDRVRPALESLSMRAEKATAPVAAAAGALLRWRNPEELRGWVQGLGNELTGDPNGAALRAALDSLGAVAHDVSVNLEALRSFAVLRKKIEGGNARDAMATILAGVAPVLRLSGGASASALSVLLPDTWMHGAGLAERVLVLAEGLGPRLRERVRNDREGPVADLRTAGAALTQAADSLQDVSRDAVALVARVLGLPPALVAADLPEPAGLRRRAIGTDLATDIRLTDICAARRENDEVRVEYRFFAGERQIASRTDRFRLRLFGWRSRVSAGLAFAVRENTETWRPGAAVSWIFTRAGWPKGNSRGLGDPSGLGRIGLGLTTVNLHFESAESIELGIGPSLSLLGDRVIVGGGWNLQAHGDHLYALLSVRLLDVARDTH
ncbi:MAG TPA: hypothetical protein VFO71_08230 [Gemmatimonadales bacterium]|nr:hypothetical protein [Gemmatimonadales bacterium]